MSNRQVFKITLNRYVNRVPAKRDDERASLALATANRDVHRQCGVK